MKKFLFSFAFLIAFQGFSQEVKIPNSVRQAMNRVDTSTIRSHIAYLADDKLKGRLPGTEGYQMAVDYVIDQYKMIGVLPGGDPGEFTQKMILRKSIVNNQSAIEFFQDKNGNTDSLIFVIIIGVSRKPDSVNHVVPVISPFPFKLYQLANKG